MKARSAERERKTGETLVRVRLDLDGSGEVRVETGVGFFDHMLNLFAYHAGWDLTIRAEGDLVVDDHHLVEDVAIVMGRALRESLGEKKGIRRYASEAIPMDEVLVLTAIDLSGRAAFVTDYTPERERVGELSTEMVAHFWKTLATEVRMALHIRMMAPGDNEHHRVEAVFKSVGRVLRQAVSLTGHSDVPSTKGVLE